jgi:S1-C subfamily serine protease
VSHSTSGFGPQPEADPPSSHRGLGSHPPAPDGYQVSPYGAPHGLRPIPRQLRPPPESSGNSFAGVFLTLIIIAVVLVGTVGLGKGLVRLNLVGSDPANASSYQDNDPVAARPVSGPLTHEDAVELQRTVGPTLVDVTAELTSQNAIGSGTGIVLTSDGEILTNNHVIRGASSVRVTDIGNGRTYPATVIGYDPKHDIAVLQARGAFGLHTAKLGNSDTVQVGDQVAAIGNAGGVGGKPSVATGPVTDLNRTIKSSDELTGGVERLNGLIEAKADIQPGDSGGPMVNTSGEVIGVDVAASVDSRNDTPNGTGFAIPINDAMSVAQEIQGGSSTEAVHIGETGLLDTQVSGRSDQSFRDAMADLGQSGSDPTSTDGTFVVNVTLSSPAEPARLQPGDVITAANGAPIVSTNTLDSLVSVHRPGDRLIVTWLGPSGQQRTQSIAPVSAPPR